MASAPELHDRMASCPPFRIFRRLCISRVQQLVEGLVSNGDYHLPMRVPSFQPNLENFSSGKVIETLEQNFDYRLIILSYYGHL